MNIDWSKAPEDATHAGTKVSKDVACWYRDNGAGQFDYWYASKGELHRDGWKPLKQAPAHWPLCARPVQAWNGEGLPPVGTVCEYQTLVNREWKQTTVLAHHLGFAVHSWSVDGDDMEVDAAPPQDFRPIRTPDQIAAEEQKLQREQLAYLIAGYVGFDDPRETDTKLAAYIFDHEYRKQVAP